MSDEEVPQDPFEMLNELRERLKLPKQTHYRLDEKGEPVPCELMEWACMFEDGDKRRVAETTIGEFWISTVFLGLDHGFASPIPILWETMIFCDDEKNPLYQDQDRCGGSREQALAMHERCVSRVKEWCAQDTLPRRWWRHLKYIARRPIVKFNHWKFWRGVRRRNERDNTSG